METIRNYLESMFASLPNTPEVLKAKDELLQMMEDKFDELTASGVSENEAVGTVISEFGNLDELADDLGIRENLPAVRGEAGEQEGYQVTREEAERFLKSNAGTGLLRSIGICLCIVSVASPLIGEFICGHGLPDGMLERVFVAGMFVLIAAGVALIVASAAAGSRWSFLQEKPCYLDYATFNYVKNEKERSFAVHTAMKVIGIMLCILCFVPAAVLDGGVKGDSFDTGSLGGAMLFFAVGAGVLLIVLSNSLQGGYERLLNLNDIKTVGGNYHSGNKRKEVRYENEKLGMIMSVYKPTVLSLYLIWSFLTFDWHITWIIWPVSVVIRKVIETNLGSERGN